jgi:hypothetical protein
VPRNDIEKMLDDDPLADLKALKILERKARPIRLVYHPSGGPLNPNSWIKGVLEILTNTSIYDIVLKCT